MNLIRVNCMFLPMPRVLVQTRMGVEKTLGCDLAFRSMPRQYERILVAAVGSLGTRSPRGLLR